MNRQFEIRCATTIALAAVVFGVSRDAGASGTCLGGGSTSTTNTNPTVSWCAFENGIVSGTGVSVLAQDQETSANSGTYALEADSLHNTAIFAYAEANAGPYAVYGQAPGGNDPGTNAAIYGDATNSAGTGVLGSGDAVGVYGFSNGGIGVIGSASSSPQAPPSYTYGVWGTSTNSDGVHGDVDNTSAGVGGVNSGNGQGVSGGAKGTGWAVSGQNSNTGSCSGNQCAGVYGQSTNGYGVYGNSSNNDGVHGEITVTGAAAVSAINRGTTGNSCALYAESDSTGAQWAGYFVGNVYVSKSLTCGGSCSSDARLKKNIEPLANPIDRLLQVKGVTYEWKTPDDLHPAGIQTGVIAQNVERVFPHWVKETPEGTKSLNIDQRELLGVTVESIRTLKTENDLLKERVAALENGRQPRISGFNLNGVGFGVGGLAIGLGLVIVSRRKREEKAAQL